MMETFQGLFLSTDGELLNGDLIEYAKKIKNEPIEHGYAFDRKGRLIQALKGGRVNISFGQRDLFRLSNCVFMHNHPRATSFSLPDIHAACMLNMLAMIVVTPTTLFCITPPNDDPYFTHAHFRDIARCYIIRYRMLPLSKRLEVQDEIWNLVAGDMNMNYRKVPIG